jgi:GGDEF domain-containing protein
MDSLTAGFWGAFFGTVALMLAASLTAYARSMQRVALLAALSAIVSALFTCAFLGWLPIGNAAVKSRVLAHVAVGSAVVLGLMLASMLGLLRKREVAHQAYGLMAGGASLALVVGWALRPEQALALASLMAFAVGCVMLALSIRSARRGDRLAWAAVVGVTCMLVALTGLSAIALVGRLPWPVHAASAVAGMAYLAVMAGVLWSRYSYLLELSQVMAHGPSYDPVTRMRSHSETGQMMGAAFFRRGHGQQPVGVIVVSIANLYALDNLHGRGAYNHALFVCATRLRSCVPQDVQMGRLADDGFLLLVPDARDTERLRRLARQVRERLSRPLVLSTSREPAQLDAGQTTWVAELGVGVLSAGAQMRPSLALTTARAMSRTAWTFPSRLAWFDEAGRQIAELPQAVEPA